MMGYSSSKDSSSPLKIGLALLLLSFDTEFSGRGDSSIRGGSSGVGVGLEDSIFLGGPVNLDSVADSEADAFAMRASSVEV